MKIAVLADIHANLVALETVLADIDTWAPDAVMVAGDVINRGPQPVECLERVLERINRDGWKVLRGNHEDFVLTERNPPPDRAAWENEVFRHSTWTSERLGALASAIEAWPDQAEVEAPDGQEVRSVHASMVHNRHGLYEHMSDEDLLASIHPSPAVLAVGHTHVPFVRWLNGTLVVNVGAVGLPFDRDPRASYARLVHEEGGWQASIVRLDYDRAVTETAFHTSRYLADGGPMVTLILDELRHARPRLRHWHDRYEKHVAEGKLTVEESVRKQLASET